MTQVTELGYLGIAVSDADAWKGYASEVLGLQVRDDGEKDRFYLRMDDWHHRIAVHVGAGDDYLYAGWRVGGRPDLDAIARQLESANIPFESGSATDAEERHVLGLLKLEDPAGNAVEVFYGPELEAKDPFHPGRPMFGRFLTGRGGLGHMLLRQPDMMAGLEFYRHLGLIGDIEFKMLVGDQRMDFAFLSMNARQHSVAFGAGDAPKAINHVMLEYTDIRDLGISHDIALKREIPMPMNLGMHANDQALSFYIANPSGWACELGWGGREPPAQQEFYRRDIFGHFNTASGYGLDRDVSDV